MRALVALSALLITAAPLVAQQAPAQPAGPRASTTDPRASLKAGFMDAGIAIRNMELVSTTPRPASFTNPANPGDFGFVNSDLAFHKDYVFQGGYYGVQIWDVADPKAPKLVTAMACPGGQGDVSVHGNLMFMSVEETRGRIDCGTQGARDSVSTERFRGVRIFDISDISTPVQVAAVQTCRGSHTHSLLVSPRDKQNVYVYVSGTSPSRSPSELAGCDPRETSATTSYFRIDVIKVPLANPSQAKVVNSPRVFADAAGNMAGLWKGGKLNDSAQMTAETDQCHDITIYAELDLAAGACSGNGILLDIKDPANPKR
ncbi:MAG: LVIVD repeat-containing protein, partial [Gemmatimonadaceae bacterium]